MFRRLYVVWLIVLSLSAATAGFGQTLNVPARAANAMGGTNFMTFISSMDLTTRENTIYNEVTSGNVPNFMRTLVAVTTNAVIGGTNHTVKYFATPDYMAVGSDADYFLMPMTPLLAQRLANFLQCTLPTRKMVNDIWTKAPLHLAPFTIAPSSNMTTVPVFWQENTNVWAQRRAQLATYPLGTLTGGDKKDVVVSLLIYNSLQAGVPKPVVIYGWHQLDGTPIQPLYNGHSETYADYSHGIRFVQMFMTADGVAKTASEILNDSTLAALLSDEGTIPIAHYTVTNTPPGIASISSNVTVIAGGTGSLSVTATGSTPLNYQWRYNGSNIIGATSSALNLTNASFADGGSYTVYVSNAGGYTNANAMLTVTAFPPSFGPAIFAGGQFQSSLGSAFDSAFVFEATTNFATWKPVAAAISSSNVVSFADAQAANSSSRFYRAHSASSQLLTDFEGFTNGTSVLFQKPSTSGSTTNFLDLTAGDFAYVTNVFPAGHSTSNVLVASWTFKTNTTNPWLRLTTFSTANIPNPIVSSNHTVQFDVYCNRDVYITLGLRETNPSGPIGSDGGTSGAIEWVGGSTANTSPPKGRFVAAGQWTRVTFFIPFEPVRAFTGNGVLDTTTGKFVLEHVAVVPGSTGATTLYLDDFRLIDLTP